MTSLERAEQSRVRDLINAGAEVTGSAAASVAGLGIGYTLSGPTGAVAGATFGAVAGPTARIMLQDMAHGALDFTYRRRRFDADNHPRPGRLRSWLLASACSTCASFIHLGCGGLIEAVDCAKLGVYRWVAAAAKRYP
jgi:hypothetical protein